MKKTILITALSSLTLLLGLVGCKRTNKKGDSKSKTVLDRWVDNLDKDDIKLNSIAKLNLTLNDGKQSTTSTVEKHNIYQYSNGKYADYAYSDSTNYVPTFKVKLDDNKIGNVGIDYENKLGYEDAKENENFNNKYKNPLKKSNNKYTIKENTTDTFLLTNSSEIDAIIKKITNTMFTTTYPMTFNSLEFKEENSKLKLTAKGNGNWNSANGAINGEATVTFDVTSGSGDIDFTKDIKPFSETESSNKLKTALKDLQDKTSYTSKTTMIANGKANEIAKVQYDLQGQYETINQYGITKDSSGKYYNFTATDDMRKTWSKTTDDGKDASINYDGTSQSDKNAVYNYKPVYNTFSSDIFEEREVTIDENNDGKPDLDNDNTEIKIKEYRLKNGVLSTSDTMVSYMLGYDFKEKSQYIMGKAFKDNNLSGLHAGNTRFRLDKNNKIQSFYFDIVDSKNNPTGIVFKTEYSKQNNTINDFTEKTPKELVGSFQLPSDPSNSDQYLQNGLKVQIRKNKDGTPSVIFSIGINSETVTGESVDDGAIHFTFGANNTNAVISYNENNEVVISIGGVNYTLIDQDVYSRITEIENELNSSWDPTYFDSVIKDGQTKSDFDTIKDAVDALKIALKSCTSVLQADKLYNDFLENTAYPIQLRKNKDDLKSHFEEIANEYDDTNGENGKKSDKEKVSEYIRETGIYEEIEQCTNINDLNELYNRSYTLRQEISQLIPLTKQEKEQKISDDQQDLNNIDIPNHYSYLTTEDSTTLQNALNSAKDSLNSTDITNLDTKISSYDTFQNILESVIYRIPEELRGMYEATKVGETTPVNLDINNYSINFDNENDIKDIEILGSDIIFTTSTTKFKLQRDENNNLVLIELNSDGSIKENGEKYNVIDTNFANTKQTSLNVINSYDFTKFLDEILYDKNSQKTDMELATSIKEQSINEINNAINSYQVRQALENFFIQLAPIAKEEAHKFIESVINQFDNTNTGEFGRQSKFGPNQTDRKYVLELLEYNLDINNIEKADDPDTIFNALDNLKADLINDLTSNSGVKTINDKQKEVDDFLTLVKGINETNFDTELHPTKGTFTSSDKAKILEIIEACINKIESCSTLGAKYYYYSLVNEYDWLEDGSSLESITCPINGYFSGNFTATENTTSAVLSIAIDEYSITITDSNTNTVVIKGSDQFECDEDQNRYGYYLRFEYNNKYYEMFVDNSGTSFQLDEIDAFGDILSNGESYSIVQN